MTKMSSLSVLRETAVTGAPGAAWPPLMCHQPCQPSAKSGSQAAVYTPPSVPVTKMSSLSVLRDTTSTAAPGAAWPPLMCHQPCQPSAKSGCQAADRTWPLTSVRKTSRWSALRVTVDTSAWPGTIGLVNALALKQMSTSPEVELLSTTMAVSYTH